MITETIFECSLLTIVYMSVWFVAAQIKKNNSIADIAWGLGIMLIGWYSFFKNNLLLPRHILITTLATLWGLRISGYVLMRNWGKKEDVRYTQMKQQRGKKEKIYSFFAVFMLQGFFMLLISFPLIVVNSSSIDGLTLLDYLGTAIWLVGYLFETISDIQLYLFLQNSKNRGKILTSGLWKYSRHPNYFGEMIIWWGIWIIALAVPYGWITIIGPLTITYLLLYVSGIPLAEKEIAKLEGYEQYTKQTNIFIPWFAQTKE